MNTKKIIMFLSIVIIGVFGVANAEDGAPLKDTVKITADKVNVQVKDTARVIDQLAKDTTVKVVSQANGWLQIKYGDNDTLEGQIPLNKTDYTDPRYEAIKKLCLASEGATGYGCEGFVTYVYQHILNEKENRAIFLRGIAVEQCGRISYKVIGISDLKAKMKAGANMDDFLKIGDVCYDRGKTSTNPGHAGVYIGDGKIAEANVYNDGKVYIRDFSQYSRYRNILKIMRVFEGNEFYVTSPNATANLMRFDEAYAPYDYEALKAAGIKVD